MDQPLPGLGPPSGAAPDLRITFGALPSWLTAESGSDHSPWYPRGDQNGSVPGLRVWTILGGRFYRLQYVDGPEFLVDAGANRMWSRWPEDLTLEDTATYLLGPVMAFVLLLRGTMGLHASAIVVCGRAVAVAGQPEAGKSTAAAALARLGYAVLSDDVVTLVEDHGTFLVRPAHPQIRLWPKSAEALFGFADALPRLTPNWD